MARMATTPRSMARKTQGSLPEASFSMSSTTVIRRTSRWLLDWAMETRRAAFSGRAPAAPPTIRPSDPAMEVKGVRSSWLTVETNSSFIRSTSRRPEMSRMKARPPLGARLGGQQVGQPHPRKLMERSLEDTLGGRVGALDAALGVQDHDAVHGRVEDRALAMRLSLRLIQQVLAHAEIATREQDRRQGAEDQQHEQRA